MVFSSPVFLFYFLPAAILSYFIFFFIEKKGTRLKNSVLLFFNLIFYLYGSGQYFVLLLLVTFFVYIFGIFVNYVKFKKLLYVSAIIFPLILLFFYKYTNFIVSQYISIANSYGLPVVEQTSIILPIGISFYVFQCISYVIDVYRNDEKPERNFFDLLVYISMFPHLIAGPIVRYSTISKKLHEREVTVDNFALGSVRFIYGLSKKIILADSCGQVADAAYGIPSELTTSSVAIIGTFAYFLQIYFDFSAYTDMAIGLARIFGFRFPENFNRPYSSSSVTEFWRRWHITLSSWFRDYLYIYLGGSRKGKTRTYINLWIVFLCTGIWHGANWTFLFWGVYHGGLLFIERLFNLRTHERFVPFWRVITVLLIMLSWVLFRADSLGQAGIFYSQIFYPRIWDVPDALQNVLTHKNIFFIFVGSISLILPRDFVVGKYLENSNHVLANPSRIAVMTLLMLYSTFLIASNNYSPFIYFQF